MAYRLLHSHIHKSMLLAFAVLGLTGCERLTQAQSPISVAPPPADRGEVGAGVEAVEPMGPPRPEPEPGATPDGAAPARPDLDDPGMPTHLPGPEPRGPIPEGLVTTTVLGLEVQGLDPELVERLREAERLMNASPGDGPETYGVASISGYRPGSRYHSLGLAVDLNYFANPYIMHERGEEELDARLAPVYHRIARLMLGRDSVIPEQITLGTPSEERSMRLYDELREESRAMVTYFRLMRDREAVASHLQALREPVSSEYLPLLLPDGSAPTAEGLQRQMMADYVTLAGRPGPPVPGLEYPAAEDLGGDPPFAGDPLYRGPEKGFMNIPREVVRALVRVGLRWGAVDFGRSSGDVMHFDLPRAVRSP